MSMMCCEKCDALIDTDYDVECWQEDDSCLCEPCRERKFEAEESAREEKQL